MAVIYDIIIIGQGFAGAAAAVKLAALGYRIATVDKHAAYPQGFRAEQVVGEQVAQLEALGLLDCVVGRAPRIETVVAYDAGGLIRYTQTPHYGVDYPDMVAGLRAAIPPIVTQHVGRVTRINTTGPHRAVTLNDGRTLTGFLVVLAGGLHRALHSQAGMHAGMVSERHSVAMGFDVSMPASDHLVTVFFGTSEDQVDYLTVFPFKNGRWRANLFGYGDPSRLADIGLPTAMRGMSQAIGPLRITSDIDKWTSSIAVNHGITPGIVAIGDAYQTPCPCAGTGVRRLLVDIAALLRYVPSWLDRYGSVSAGSIAQYYDDAARREENARCIREAHYMRDRRLGTSFKWKLHRRMVRTRALVAGMF